MKMVSAILLGAGESKRMGANKLTLPWQKKTVFEQVLNTLLRSEVKGIVVVLGQKTGGMRNLLENRGVTVVMNPHFRGGMSSSIQRGVRALDPKSQGILIALGDHPMLKTRTINALIHAFDSGKRSIVVPSFRGKRGHPVIFDRRYKDELLSLKGDVGGRSIMERHAKEVGVVRVKSEGVVRDIDTREDYRKGMKRSA